MQKRIFYAIFGVCGFLLLTSNVFLFLYFDNFFKTQIINDMKKQAATLLSVQKFDENLSKMQDFNTQNRLTIIDENGVVLFDNFAFDLENHLNRAEIKDTLTKGESFKIRYSQSLKQNLIYYAKAYKKANQTYIIRIATTQKSLTSLILNLALLFVCEMLFLLFICFFIAKILAKKILNPIKNINLKELHKNDAYSELGGIIKKIKTQNKTIKKAYKKLLQKQQESLLLAQNIKDGFMLLNAKGMIILANNNIENFLKLNNATSLENIENSAFCKLCAQMLDEFKSQKIKQNKNIQMPLNDEECELIFSPIFVEEKFKGMMILIQNLSEEKLALKLRKEFSANVTHELKTPLTSILASSEMIKNKLVQRADMPKFIDTIYSESKRLLEMIDEILRLSFFDENKQNLLQKQKINLKSIILKVVSRLEQVAQKQGVKLLCDLEEQELFGVYELVENLIYNLCDNAIKYNKPNGFVKISLKRQNGVIKLTVKDSGIGIKKEHHSRIFERFFCVDKSRSKELGGTGLGLSIVKHACFYHKAHLTLQSEFGVGSEFCVVFDEETAF